MASPLPTPVYIALHIITIISLIIAFAAQCVALSSTGKSGGWKVRAGCAPKTNCNGAFALNLAELASLFLFLICAALEVLLVLALTANMCLWSVQFRGGYLRAVVYFVGGILTLGMAGDLGIAGGSLLFICGLIWLVIQLLKQFSVVGEDNQQQDGQTRV
jgi:hypothetical protein